MVVPGAVNTIAHSQFGNLVVGNYNTTTPAGSAFIFDASTGAFSTNNKAGAASTSAYGIWGNRIAGGYIDAGGGGIGHAYIFNQSTGVFTQYDAPGGTIDTHFEGITAGGRAGEFNLIAGSTDLVGGSHAWAVHVDAAGVATWTEITVPGATSTSGNSIYEDKAIGIFVQGGIVRAYIATVPGLYNPVTNTGTLIANTTGATALSATNGDDVVNSGTIVASAPNSTGIASGTYGVIQNRGTVVASSVGSTAVQINGTLGSFINTGLLSATSGAFALATGSTAVAPTIVNSGIIDGQVAIAGGQFTRFQNSGWMGISAAGSGITHTTSGVYAQTSTGILALRVGPTTSDSLQVNGAARLNGTAVANFQPGTLGKSYTLLTATSGYTGTFSTLATQNMPAFLNASLNYGASAVTLNLHLGLCQHLGPGRRPGLGRPRARHAFNAGGGLGAMPALFGLSRVSFRGARPALRATAPASASRSLRRRRSVHRAHEPAPPRGAPKSWRRRRAPSRRHCLRAAEQLGGLGQRLRRRAVAQCRSGDGRGRRAATIAGGAFGVDYRFAPRTLVGLAVGLSDSNYWRRHRRHRPGDRHACRPLRRAGLAGSTSTPRWPTAASTATPRAPITGIGTTETANRPAISSQLAGRVEVGRPFEVSEFTGGAARGHAVRRPAAGELWTPGIAERA